MDTITGLVSNNSVGRESQRDLSGLRLNKSALTYDAWGAIVIPLSRADYPEVIGCCRCKGKRLVAAFTLWLYGCMSG